MIGNLIGCLFVLFILFGLLCNLTGDENKGMQIINNCVTAIVIYSMIIVIFSAKNSEIIKLNIPFWNGIVKYGTLKSYLKASAGGFALDFIQLVTLVLLINWVSNIMSFDKAGFIGILTSKFIIVFIGILIYGFIMQFIEKNIFFKLAVYAIECIITGGSIVVTPLLIIKTITGTKQEAFVNAYILDSLKQSNIGKAITASISSSIVSHGSSSSSIAILTFASFTTSIPSSFSMSKSITSSFIFTLLQLGCLSALTIMSLPSIDVPVFVLTLTVSV